MFKRFYPDIYIDSAYDIDYEGLYNKGYRGIIFDIDNTLVEHGAPVTKRCSDLFDRLRAMGFDTCIISNNKEKNNNFRKEVVSGKILLTIQGIICIFNLYEHPVRE